VPSPKSQVKLLFLKGLPTGGTVVLVNVYSKSYQGKSLVTVNEGKASSCLTFKVV